MLNIIKMDLYRMLKTKSMYVIWIVLAAILLITTSLCKTDYELLTEKDAMKQEQVTEPTVDNLNVGMMVTLPTEPGKKVTVYDIFFANSQGKLYALLLVIFTVLFSTADISSGSETLTMVVRKYFLNHEFGLNGRARHVADKFFGEDDMKKLQILQAKNRIVKK